jgi:hypothetical protein
MQLPPISTGETTSGVQPTEGSVIPSQIMAESEKAIIRYVLVIIALVVMLLPCAAWADESCDFVQFTCIPELDYFALRTIEMQRQSCLMGAVKEQKQILQNIQEQKQLYEIRSLVDHPYICKLPNFTVSTEIAHIDASAHPEHGECGARTFFDMLIRIDGEKADEFWAYGRCRSLKTHLVEVDPFGLIHIAMPELSNPSKMSSFFYKNLRKTDGKLNIIQTMKPVEQDETVFTLPDVK